MSNRRLLALAAVLWLAIAGTAAARSYDDIVASGEIVMAVYRDFPPFSSEQAGEMGGVDIDLGRAIAARLGLTARFMPVTAGETVDDDLRNAVWKGHYLDRRVADVMLHVPVDRQFARRNPNAYIFAPYFRDRIVVARDPERIGARDGVEIFEDQRVGVELDTLADLYLSSRLAGQGRTANVVHFPTLSQAVEALADGEVAAVMGTGSELAALLVARGAHFPLAPMPSPGLTNPAWDLGLAVKDGNRQLAQVIEDVVAILRDSGTIAAIFGRHGLPYQPPGE